MIYIKKYFLFLIMLGLITVACSDLQNDLVVPSKISTHGTEVFNKTSSSFHGRLVIAYGTDFFDGCRQCHASNLSGGTAKISCATGNCHPTVTVHTKDIMNPSSENFHGNFIENLNWNMKDCAKCHGANYSGGISSPSCNTCHKNPGGPEACNTCHGDFGNPNLIYPPRALNNAIATTDPGVGAHTKHLTNLSMMTNTTCSECHIVPKTIYDAGHFDALPKAEVIFGSFTNSGALKAAYNFGSKTCTNTYCHGNFEFTKAQSQYQFAYTAEKMTGNNYSPNWTKVDGTEGKCGTCHGLPPAGHMSAELKSCSTCHPGIVKEVVVNKVLTLEIADKTKHINGKINVFGN